MKELTIKEKARRYDEAIVRAKSKIKNDKDHLLYEEDITYIFPELKDDEDKIRNFISNELVCLRATDGKGSDRYEELTNAITWLEKQGEQNLVIEGTFINADEVRENFMQEVYRVLDADFTNDRANQIIDAFDNLPTIIIRSSNNKVESKFHVGDTIIKKHNSDINDFGQFTITDIIGGKYWYNDKIICDIIEQDEWEIYKPIEQNNAWSEEDERLCKCIIKDQEEALDDVRNDKYGHSEIISDLKDMYRERIDWLKSLKERMKGE